MDRNFKLLPGAVQVFLEGGEDPQDVVPVLADAAGVAREKQIQALLVVSGLGDPATAQSVSAAIEQIHAVGAPLKIAFVACMYPQYSAYHFAERYARRFGIDAKVLVSINDAKHWLGVDEYASASAPAQ